MHALSAHARTPSPHTAPLGTQVRVDGWERNLTFDETAYPYPSRIDWRRVVVDVPAWEESSLLAKLAAMPAAEVAERLRYIRSIGHWLTFDRRLDGVEDAADGAVAEIGRLLRGHDPHAVRRGFERSEGGRAERARAENASALAGEEYRAHLEEAAEAEAARVARAEDARARFATPPKRRPRPHETPFTVNM